MNMFTVRVADNFHYEDDSETYTHGRFASWMEAVSAAKKIVDDSLAECFLPGMTVESLYWHYTSFGDDPYIVPEGEGQRFARRSLDCPAAFTRKFFCPQTEVCRQSTDSGLIH